MKTLRGEAVDRPAVSFYEVGGFDVDPANPDPFNIYNDPSWRPLLDLAEAETDIIRMRKPEFAPVPGSPLAELTKVERRVEGRALFKTVTVKAPGRTLTCRTRRDADLDTVWEIEHLLKNEGDVKAYLSLPDDEAPAEFDPAYLVAEEKRTGDAGIVMVDVADPICIAASHFSMEDYTVLAMTENALFHRLLEKAAATLYRQFEVVSRKFPGRLWRVCGPEYATPPYLPPRLFEEYVVRYTKPIVDIIHKHGGYARIHCHGRIKEVLPMIMSMGIDGLDPIEPEPQGNVRLADVRREYGDKLVLFGNIEAADIENKEPAEFEKTVATALAEGTSGAGRGFVLMPSACPYGRKLPARALENYRTMLRMAKSWGN